MDSLQRLTVSCLILAGSAVASFLFISGAGPDVLTPVKWGLYFPFYGVMHLSSAAWQLAGIRVLKPVLFFAGAVLTAVYLVVLLEKIPKNVTYTGVGVLFFIFLLICGRAAFVRFIFIPQSTVKAAVYSVKVFFEFLVVLVLVYLVCDEVDLDISLKKNIRE